MAAAGKNIPAYALTTREHVKERLNITDDQWDTLIDRYIAQVSDFIQNRCNRRFLLQTYTNEMYSVYGEDQVYLLLNQSPVFQKGQTGTVTTNSAVVTLADTSGMKAGMQVIGDGIPDGTKILTVDSATQITLTQNGTATSSSAYVLVNGVMSLQYRAGLPSNPSWTDFIHDQWELVEQGESGILRVYGPLALARYINNAVRVTYEAGYLIDWDNETDETKHTLPRDLTMLAENLIVRFFKRRENAGKTSESLQGATIAWDKQLDVVDQQSLLQFTRTPRFY